MGAQCVLAVLVGQFAIAAAVCRAENVALDKAVTLNGTFGVIRSPSSWPDASVHPVAAASTITDGVFVGNGTEWQTGTVWWDATQPGSTSNSIDIDLQGEYQITGVTIEADNNDNYGIEYRDPATNAWQPWVYAYSYNYNGMLTRSGSVGPIVTDAFRIYGYNGDGYYSVSEFQAEGTAVPLPATLRAGLVLIPGAIALPILFRRRTAAR
jgi:hypothetical protein